MTATKKLGQIKAQLTNYKKRTQFIFGRDSRMWANKLSNILKTIRINAPDPLTGLQLVARFYETDQGIIGHADDSSGMIGDVYRGDAAELFAHFAKECEDKQAVAKILLELNVGDRYGVRDRSLNRCHEYLPESAIRQMIEHIQNLYQPKIKNERDMDFDAEDYANLHNSVLLTTLTRAIKDPILFEKTYLQEYQSLEKVPVAFIVEIAEVYFEAGDVQTAKNKLLYYPEKEGYYREERDALMAKIHQALGESDSLKSLLYQRFESPYTIDNFNKLLDFLGKDHFQTELQRATQDILHLDWNLKNSEFLAETKQYEALEDYVIKNAEDIDGGYYSYLPWLANVLLEQNRPLPASLIYRQLLGSILQRAYRRAYGHGIRHLKLLDRLAPRIDDWRGQPDHDTFKEALHKKHKAKYTFWGKYDGL